MTAIRYVTAQEMKRRTGMGRALGYAFPDEDEILIRKGLPKEVEMQVREHEFEHIQKGEEGPFGPLAGALIGAGASILGGVIGSSGAKSAARSQERASREAIAFQRESRDLALEYQRPYREASYSATSALMDMVGLPRTRRRAPVTINAAPATGNFNPFIGGGGIGGAVGRILQQRQTSQPRTGAADVPELADYPEYTFQADPGYEFRMGEGMRALERGAAARGGLLSGGFARKALRYAQDYASNEYQNVYNRIASIAGFGQVATNSSVGAIMGTGANVGNAMINAGEARASGYIGQGNAWSNAINQIGMINWGGGGGYSVPSDISSMINRPVPDYSNAGF